MNRKIPFHELASLLAANCNISSEEAEDFIKNFFDQIAGALSDGDSVKIKGIGLFSITHDKTSPVSFVPDAEIADTINAPFALFEPEVLNDSLSEETLADIEVLVDTNDPTREVFTDRVHETGENVPRSTPKEEEISIKHEEIEESTSVENSEFIETTICDESDKSEKSLEESVKPEEATTATLSSPPTMTIATDDLVSVTPQPSTENTVVSTPVTTISTVSTPMFPEEEPEEYLPEDHQEQKSGAGFGWGLMIGIIIGLALGACAVYFAIDYIIPTPTLDLQEEIKEDVASNEEVSMVLAEAEAVLRGDTIVSETNSIASTDVPGNNMETKSEDNTPETPPAQPVNAPIKDTVKAGYLLHDMAKKHYGNKCFWVYIYEENKAKISNPNRVTPGLVLVIPPAEKYGINASNTASVKAANEKAGKILAKYPR